MTMTYVQATRPEGHNGGKFFEHEIHIRLDGDNRFGSVAALKEYLNTVLSESIGVRHEDYRIKTQVTYVRKTPGNLWDPPNRITVAYVRFTDKNKALLFKMSVIL